MNTPRALKLFSLNEHGKVILNDEVKGILENENIKKKKVCVISICGPFRGGKSFFLNFLIRGLRGDDNGLITGFPWQAGNSRKTVGILMWPEVFTVKASEGEEVAVILLDTQGTFDTRSTTTEFTTFVALSIIMSSVQIFNLKDGIYANNFQELRLFSDFGKVYCPNNAVCNQKPYQKLLFLIRDWSNSHECSFGTKGGKKYLDFLFKQNKEIEETLYKNFESVECCLLPYPGKMVDHDEKFNGSTQDIDKQFMNEVKDVVASLISPENVLQKIINGTPTTVDNFWKLVQKMPQYFQEDKINVVTSISRVMVEMRYDFLELRAIDHYKRLMDKCETREEAKEIKRQVMEEFQKTKKPGNKKDEEERTKQLDKKLSNIYARDYSAKLILLKLLNWKKVVIDFFQSIGRKIVSMSFSPRVNLMVGTTESLYKLLSILSIIFILLLAVLLTSVLGNGLATYLVTLLFAMVCINYLCNTQYRMVP